MGKPQQKAQGGKTQKAKAIKEGQVKKHTEPKFKQTPKGKVALINDKKNGVKNQKQPLNKNQSPKKNEGGNQNAAKSNKKPPQKKKNEELKKDEKEDSSDEDINEGITLPEDSLMEEDDDDSSVEEGDESTVNILGESLADQSDSDDEDFEASDDEKAVEKKGLKMFKGVKTELNESASSMNTSVEDEDDDDEDDDDEADDNDDDDDDDDDDEEEEESNLKALIDGTIEDDEDDEDFKGDEHDEDEDDDIDESEDGEAENESDLNQSKNSSISSPTKKMLTPEEKAELDKRTIFVGNVPKDVKDSKIRGEFNKFGPIENFRIRNVVPESPKMPLKLAAQKKKIHAKVHTVCVFVVYKSADSATRALTMNGKKFEGNYLRVDKVNQSQPANPKKTIFLGNLPFDIEDNHLWDLFEKCGKIESVRTVRDRWTGACRGSGFINFATEDSVTLALDLNGSKIGKRLIRVSRYTPNRKKPRHDKNSPKNNKRPRNDKDSNSSPKKLKSEEVEIATRNSINAEKRKKNKANKMQGQQQNGSFQGQKAEGKKKDKKPSKFEKKKKTMAGKLMAKPKKPVA